MLWVLLPAFGAPYIAHSLIEAMPAEILLGIAVLWIVGLGVLSWQTALADHRADMQSPEN